MRSLTSIPAYLWRNTLRRWLENPASPITKFLVPFLFGLLALLVFGLLRGVEAELQAQLQRADLRTITLTEIVRPEEAENLYLSALESPPPWSEWCESSDLFLQAPITASSRFFERMPIVGYIEPPDFVDLPVTAPGDARPALILTHRSMPGKLIERGDYIEVAETYRIEASYAPLPRQFEQIFQTQAIALVPAEMLELPLARFHTRLQILTPNPGISPQELEMTIRRFSSAENRDLKIYSARGVIEQLAQFNRRQELARVVLGLGIAIILSLVLGSLSLLEFRQELYLFALLRSFGVKPAYLFVHYLLETAMITTVGSLSAYGVVKQPIAAFLREPHEVTRMPLPFSFETIGQSDYLMLVAALGAGVLLSALPLIPGLRRPAGLLLP